MVRAWLLLVATMLAVGGASLPSFAQPKAERPGSPETPKRTRTADDEADELNRKSQEAFGRRDYAAAEQFLREQVKLEPANFVPWYNLACALSSQGKTEEAGPMLEKAIELGFSDLRHMEVDVHLAALRKTPNYQRIVKGWNEILGAHAEQRLEQARKKYGPSYTYERDDEHRLAYASAFPAESFSTAKGEIGKAIGWWETYVSPPSLSAPPPKAAPTPWVLIVLPNQQDYAEWARARYGDAWERIGGVYSHDQKSLIAKDTGSTLRHEFWHVLHWRDMDTRGQRHPIWIMEGLCSLMEDVAPGSKGQARPIASWRTNQAGQLARTGKLTPWEVLFGLDQAKFVGTRPLAFYGQSRAIFMWLFEEDKLAEWYAAYTAGYSEDKSGLSAFEKVFNKPVKKVEADFRAWLRKLPTVDEDFPAGSAVLPFNVDPVGAGDGLIVSASNELERAAGGGGRPRFMKAGGIQPRDVIMSIDGHAVRERGDLIRLMADYTPGVEVTVTYRRMKKVATTKVTLMEKR